MSSNNGKVAARTKSDKTPWFVTLLITLFCYLLVKPTILLMLGLGHLFKGWATRTLALPARSIHWHRWYWLLKPIQCLAGFMFLVLAVQLFKIIHVEDTWDRAFPILSFGALCLVSAWIFDILAWLEEYAEDPTIQKYLAGQRAEQVVKECIDKYQDQSVEARSLHNALLVFHPETTNEFSIEVDHLLITRRNIFVIETKYKSGTIMAKADALCWQVTSLSGSSNMRNALKQAKNAAQVLQQRLSIPCEIIPIVTIIGNDVRITDGPTNVVAADDLPKTLNAFEFVQEMRISNPSHILAQLQSYISTDSATWQRHIARTEAARIQNEAKEIIHAASLH